MVRVKVRLNKEAGNVSVSVKCRQVYSDWLSVPGKGKSRPTDMESLKPLLLLVFYYVEKVSRFQLSKEVSPLPLHTLSVSLCLSLSLSPSLSHSLSLTHSLSLSLSLSLSHTHFLSHSLPLSLTLFLSLTLTLSLFLSHSLYPTLSLSFSLPPPAQLTCTLLLLVSFHPRGWWETAPWVSLLYSASCGCMVQSWNSRPFCISCWWTLSLAEKRVYRNGTKQSNLFLFLLHWYQQIHCSLLPQDYIQCLQWQVTPVFNHEITYNVFSDNTNF